nr:MAG TPA: hypothetical protein [Caudoviricetes sp.]
MNDFEKMAKLLQGCDAEGNVYTDEQLEEMKEVSLRNKVEGANNATDKVENTDPVVVENENEDLSSIPSFLRDYVKNKEEDLLADFVKEFSKRNNAINRENIRKQEEARQRAIAEEVAKSRKRSKKKSWLAKIFR